jgi:hypothetical protein
MPAWQDKFSDRAEDREVLPLRTTQLESIEERENPILQIDRPGDFKVEDTVTAASNRSRTEDRTKKLWSLFTDLRDVERQRHAPWKSTITLSTDGDVEASLTIDESRDPVAQVIGDPIQPVRGTGSFLLIVRTGRIFTFHATTESNGCDMDEYRRILGVSSI